jgi:hypothetical protein
MGNQIQKVEDVHKTEWSKEKEQKEKEQTMIYKTLQI